MIKNEVSLLVKIAPRDIDFLNKILEGYEGVALVSTEDSRVALVRISTSPSLLETLLQILKTLPRELTTIEKLN